MNCIHHWILDENSYGVCKKCSLKKQHPRPSDVPVISDFEYSKTPSPYNLDAEMFYALQAAGMHVDTWSR